MIDRQDLERAAEVAEESGTGLFSRINYTVWDDGSDIAVLILTGEYARQGKDILAHLENLLQNVVSVP